MFEHFTFGTQVHSAAARADDRGPHLSPTDGGDDSGISEDGNDGVLNSSRIPRPQPQPRLRRRPIQRLPPSSCSSKSSSPSTAAASPRLSHSCHPEGRHDRAMTDAAERERSSPSPPAGGSIDRLVTCMSQQSLEQQQQQQRRRQQQMLRRQTTPPRRNTAGAVASRSPLSSTSQGPQSPQTPQPQAAAHRRMTGPSSTSAARWGDSSDAMDLEPTASSPNTLPQQQQNFPWTDSSLEADDSNDADMGVDEEVARVVVLPAADHRRLRRQMSTHFHNNPANAGRIQRRVEDAMLKLGREETEAGPAPVSAPPAEVAQMADDRPAACDHNPHGRESCSSCNSGESFATSAYAAVATTTATTMSPAISPALPAADSNSIPLLPPLPRSLVGLGGFDFPSSCSGSAIPPAPAAFEIVGPGHLEIDEGFCDEDLDLLGADDGHLSVMLEGVGGRYGGGAMQNAIILDGGAGSATTAAATTGGMGLASDDVILPDSPSRIAAEHFAFFGRAGSHSVRRVSLHDGPETGPGSTGVGRGRFAILRYRNSTDVAMSCANVVKNRPRMRRRKMHRRHHQQQQQEGQAEPAVVQAPLLPQVDE